MLCLRPGDRLLDVGCGWGGVVRYTAHRDVRAIGVTLYAMTLRDWCANLVEHRDEAFAEVGLTTAKMWGLYLAG